jgi:hypothetical protein
MGVIFSPNRKMVVILRYPLEMLLGERESAVLSSEAPVT